MWTPPGGQGTNLKYPPSVAGAPFIFPSALPVGGVVPVPPKEAGPESPGKEEAKEQEVRKEEEGGQPASAVQRRRLRLQRRRRRVQQYAPRAGRALAVRSR